MTITPTLTPTTFTAQVAVVHHIRQGSFFDGFTWAQGATIIAAIIAALIAVIGYSIQRKAARRGERATLYGNALAAVEDYLEGPYRVRRKDGTDATRFVISDALSDVKAKISKNTALLEMHAPPEVVTAYATFVTAAREEAGPQLTDAWAADATDADAEVPLGVPYDRSNSDVSRADLVAAMRRGPKEDQRLVAHHHLSTEVKTTAAGFRLSRELSCSTHPLKRHPWADGRSDRVI